MADSCSPCQDCTVPNTGPVCPAPPLYTANSCPETVLTDCVTYTGPDNTCVGVTSSGTPMTLTQSLVAILNYLSTFWRRISSKSLVITTSGVCSDLIAIEVIPSAQSGNTLILGNDGRPYVPPTVTTFVPSKCTTYQSTTVGNVTSWVQVLDFNCISQNVTGPAIACLAPTGVSVSGITQTSAVIAFTAVGGDTYDLLVNNVPSQLGISSPFTLTNLTAGTNYSIAVRVNCTSGNTSETVLTFSTLPILLCNTPSNLQITSV